MVAGGGVVVVDTVEGVVVEANIINDYYQGPFLWLSCNDCAYLHYSVIVLRLEQSI